MASADEGIGAAGIELSVLTKFQQQFHHQEDKDELISSKFTYKLEKTSWSSNIVEEMEASIRGDGNDITFVANPKFHFLKNCYLVQDILPMKVRKPLRKKIRICLPHNFGHNIINKGSVKVDGITIQSIDSTWLDIHSQFFMPAGFRDHYNMSVGNLPFLEEWDERIPGFTVVVPQPFHYSKDPAVALPLLLGSLSRVTHQYIFRRKLSEIVRMQGLNENDTTPEHPEGKWEDIPYNWSYLEGVKQDEIFPQPKLFGRYVVVTEAERCWHQGVDKNGNRLDDHEPRVIYGENVIKETHTNTTGLGKSVSLTLHSSTPIKAMFWVAENVNALEMNNRSNYTTNPDSSIHGWNPISKTSLNYGGVYKFSEMEHYHFDMAEPFNFPSPPSEPGYNGYAIAYDTTTMHADVGIVFNSIGASGVSLTVELNDTDPYLKKVVDKRRRNENIKADEFVPTEFLSNTGETQSDGPEFKVIVYLLSVTKMTFPHEGRIKKDLGLQAGSDVPPGLV